jgi:nicotinate-nucleotide--dimethylbenzimidazole phosphoribosyltransferase
MTGKAIPTVDPPCAFVFAGDHGVAKARAVSAFPVEVTAQMVLNYAGGGAVVNVLARQFGAKVIAIDSGVAEELPEHPGVVNAKVRHGSADWTAGPAMTIAEATAALDGGASVVLREAENGLGLACIGEMGIGNTTTSSVLVAAMLGLAPEEVIGDGTGIDSEGRARKLEAVRDGLSRHADVIAVGSPLAVLAALGGLEIAGMAGAIIAAASRRIPVLIDGLISSTAALVAVRLAPGARNFLIAAHASTEPAHCAILKALEVEPLLNLGMRLGEGSGAVLAIPIVRAAAAVLAETATFESAHVSNTE